MDRINKRVKYWYMRYLMVTELFMVERWEQNLFHLILLIFLGVLGLFNHLLVVGAVRFVRQWGMHYTNRQPIAMFENNIELQVNEY